MSILKTKNNHQSQIPTTTKEKSSNITKSGEGLLSYNDGKAAFLKNGYKSVIARIDITFTCHFVYYMVAVSTCNKDDVRCKKHNEQ